MSYYRIGAKDCREWVDVLPESVAHRVSELTVGGQLWKTAENRFYELGINPDKVMPREITGIKPVDKIANMALDFVGIGALLLGASAIKSSIS